MPRRGRSCSRFGRSRTAKGLLTLSDDGPQSDLHEGDSRKTDVIQKEQERTMISKLAEPEVEPSAQKFPELSNQLEKDLVQVFKLLSDETRLRILMYLVRARELHVTALCDKLEQSQPAVSHHLALLRVAGLIEARRDGKHNYYSVRQSHFHRIIEELFQSIGDPNKDEFRFDDFVLTHDHGSL